LEYLRGISEAVDLAGRTDLWDQDQKSLNVCAMYKFKSTGWKNISFFGFWGPVSAAIVTMLLGIERGEKDLWIEKLLSKLIHTKAMIPTNGKRQPHNESFEKGIKFFVVHTPRANEISNAEGFHRSIFLNSIFGDGEGERERERRGAECLRLEVGRGMRHKRPTFSYIDRR